jgi:hypothetical protein
MALGWGPLDLFGCNRDKPFARIDHMGLLWLLNGQKLVALMADSAAIGTQSGVTLTFRRKPTEASDARVSRPLRAREDRHVEQQIAFPVVAASPIGAQWWAAVG